MKPHTDLSAFFAPRGVAVIGASRDERKLGYGVLHNLVQHGFSGSVYPVNGAERGAARRGRESENS